MGERLLQIAAALTFAAILFFLVGCSDELDHRQRQAEWNAKVARAAMPEKGELVTIRQFSDGHYVIRRYRGGLLHTDIISRDDQ